MYFEAVFRHIHIYICLFSLLFLFYLWQHSFSWSLFYLMLKKPTQPCYVVFMAHLVPSILFQAICILYFKSISLSHTELGLVFFPFWQFLPLNWMVSPLITNANSAVKLCQRHRTERFPWCWPRDGLCTSALTTVTKTNTRLGKRIRVIQIGFNRL